MAKYTKYVVFVLLIFMSCSKVTKKAKDGLNKSGEVVGEGATEFFEGISKGVDKTLECEIILSKQLNDIGLKTGAYSFEKSFSKNKNKLILYLIFENDFNQKITAKAYNKKGLEIGRTTTMVKSAKGNAAYFEFLFDERTDIGFRNKITLE